MVARAGGIMSGSIRYLLDGEVREASGADPTRTLLEHLRGDLRRTGTKEGCAEGDCGSCTVLVGDLRETGEVSWRPVNACIQFLPMIDGKALVTVESLARGGPHPVQRAMVDHHASQCGYCTPGVVMSMYARCIGACGADGPLGEVFAGNLCRCTGYGPIIEAANACVAEPAPEVAEALAGLRRDAMLALEFEDAIGGVTRRWFAPRTLDELDAVAAAHPEAVFIAGATDVGLWVTKQRRALADIIHLGEVAELARLDETPEGLMIGAGVRYGEALPALTRLAPDLGAMVRRLGSMQVRASGTIGGNIANGSPIGDMPPALIAAGASLTLRRQGQRRTMPLQAYFLDYGRQDRAPGEYVESLFVPRPKADTLFKVFKLSKRFDQDISAVCGAFAIERSGETVTAARIAFGGMAATPRRAPACEASLIGRPWTAETIETAVAALAADFAPIDDLRASAAYRARAAGNLLRKAWLETAPSPAPTRVLDWADG
jgi:xanthine dehydrogenase small subunit